MSEERLFPEGAALVFGATGGIGRVVALEFARAGSDVAIVWRSKREAAESLAREIESLGRRASIHACDVTDTAAVDAAITDAAAAHGRVHTMVWGAGPLADQVCLAETSDAQWRRAIDVEVHGFFNAGRAVVAHMRGAGGGSIVHLGSAGDLRWPDKDGLSVAPKAANEALVKGFAREEGRYGIRANTVLVGVIEAGMFLELTRQGVFDEEWTREVHKNLALKRWGQPEEIGYAAVFLASSRAAYVTGQQIAVAGGYGI
ncbi:MULTISPECIES: SDR family oxidoreductase [unclassified Sphingomonas]|uniref:SDR family NAD(P)-dependent oxidoreductase n=1 Tax=unclassified Sphingomonas TaxID=196159 RepID=UPI000927F0C2|nr:MULTISPECIES: SDR family oxidoreductase [unclassified Sphingomonas]MBN8849810.1 SDR family oxidoreductase [Sphingomonas sp.]OJV28962.1 MAG: oxidoreductase [Sphingomonas sp. 67-36]